MNSLPFTLRISQHTLRITSGKLIAEYDSTTAAMLRSYVHGNGTDEPLLWLEGATYNDPRWLYADRQGPS